MTTPMSTGRVSVVTGASRGLGAEVAVRLAAKGDHVVLIARTVGGLEETDDRVRAAGSSATLIPLDLAKLDMIGPLGKHLYDRFGRVDSLVACHAQLGALSPVAAGDPKVWRKVIDVNLTATQHLILTLHPLLCRAPAGRVVLTTCAEATGEKPFWYAYAAAKAGLETMARMYAQEVGKTSNVQVHVTDPGAMDTRLRVDAFPGGDPAHPPPPAERADAVADLAWAEAEAA